MVELHRDHHEPDDIESLIRSARDYARPSEDMRPRILEVARTEKRERRIQRSLARMAAVVLLMVTVITAYRQPTSANGGRLYLPALEGIPLESDTRAAISIDHASWETVESFTDLRQRQARLLRL